MAQEPLKILIVEDDEDDEDDAFFIKDFLKEGLGELAPLIDHYSSIGNSLKQSSKRSGIKKTGERKTEKNHTWT